MSTLNPCPEPSPSQDVSYPAAFQTYFWKSAMPQRVYSDSPIEFYCPSCAVTFRFFECIQWSSAVQEGVTCSERSCGKKADGRMFHHCASCGGEALEVH